MALGFALCIDKLVPRKAALGVGVWWVLVGGFIGADRKGVHTGFSKRKRKLWGKHACVMLFLPKSVACGPFLPEREECAALTHTVEPAASREGAAEALPSASLMSALLQTGRGAWGRCKSVHAHARCHGEKRGLTARSEVSEVGSRTACGG